MPKTRFHVVPTWACILLAFCFTTPVGAQLRLVESNEAWQEKTPIVPPPLSGKPLIPLESPPGSELRFGIDADSIAIVDDQVVRYTIVLQGPAARTVVYEGIRCSTGEKRVYARQNGNSGTWEMTSEGWLPITHSAGARYARDLMKNGICLGSGANRSVRDIVRDLRSNRGANQLYEH